MDLEAERKKWATKDANDTNTVDTLLRFVNEHGGSLPHTMIMDILYRDFVHWFRSARANKCDPAETRRAVITLMGAMVLDLSETMGARDADTNEVLPKDVWIGEFFVEFQANIIAHLEFTERMGGVTRQ